MSDLQYKHTYWSMNIQWPVIYVYKDPKSKGILMKFAKNTALYSAIE